MILITGATGYIGRFLVSHLLKEGHSIRILSRSKEIPKTQFVKGDILDKSSLEKAAKGCSQVIHLAGLISYSLPREKLFQINLEGTQNLLAASREADKFLFSSSVSVYGETNSPANESTRPSPVNLYGESKLAAEQAVLDSGIPLLVYRISVVYGPGSPIWDGVLNFFGKGFPIPNAKTKTNLIHISDVSRAFSLGLEKGKGLYNIIGEDIPFKELAKTLASCMEIKPKFWPPWLVLLLARTKGKASQELKAFIQNRQYDGSKASQELGFVPKADLKKELKKMVDSYLKINS